MSGLLGILTGVVVIAAAFAIVLWSDKRRHKKQEERYWRAQIDAWNSRADTYVKLAPYEDWNK